MHPFLCFTARCNNSCGPHIEIVHPGFLRFGSRLWDLLILGLGWRNGIFTEILGPCRGSLGGAATGPDALGASEGRRDGDPGATAALPRAHPALGKTLQRALLFGLVCEHKLNKKNPKHRILVCFVTFSPADEGTVAPCPSRLRGPLPMHRGEGFAFCHERPALPSLLLFFFFKLIFL